MVEVCWLDAQALASWIEPDKIPNEPTLTYSVGYLAVESPEALTLVTTVNEEHVGDGIIIPHGMIHSITLLQRKRRR